MFPLPIVNCTQYHVISCLNSSSTTVVLEMWWYTTYGYSSFDVEVLMRSFISRRIPHAGFLSQIETWVKHQECPIRSAVVPVYKLVPTYTINQKKTNEKTYIHNREYEAHCQLDASTNKQNAALLIIVNKVWCSCKVHLWQWKDRWCLDTSIRCFLCSFILTQRLNSYCWI